MSALVVSDLRRHFGGLKALDGVSLHAQAGEVLAIIGPNGAGKTTLINTITGVYPPTSGSVEFGQTPITGQSAHQIAHMGIARTFQNIELFEHASVLENLLLGSYRHRKATLLDELLFLPRARKEAYGARQKAEEVIAYLELESWRDKMVSGLAYGVRKQVEFGRALSASPAFLVLDEPASGLTSEETQDLGYFIRDLAHRRGLGIIMIEHDMGLVGRVADRVIAMNEGRKIAEGSAKDVQSDPTVVACYLGVGAE